MRYSIQVRRKVLYLFLVEADSEEEALKKYEEDKILSEDVLDSDDIEDPVVNQEDDD